jgi:hypothetical protein
VFFRASPRLIITMGEIVRWAKKNVRLNLAGHGIHLLKPAKRTHFNVMVDSGLVILVYLVLVRAANPGSGDSATQVVLVSIGIQDVNV